jgi:hypothetical protein
LSAASITTPETEAVPGLSTLAEQDGLHSIPDPSRTLGETVYGSDVRPFMRLDKKKTVQIEQADHLLAIRPHP